MSFRSRCRQARNRLSRLTTSLARDLPRRDPKAGFSRHHPRHSFQQVLLLFKSLEETLLLRSFLMPHPCAMKSGACSPYEDLATIMRVLQAYVFGAVSLKYSLVISVLSHLSCTANFHSLLFFIDYNAQIMFTTALIHTPKLIVSFRKLLLIYSGSVHTKEYLYWNPMSVCSFKMTPVCSTV